MTLALRSLVVLVCLLAPVLSNAQKAEIPAAASFTLGDRWEWRQVDNRTKLEEAKLTRSVVSLDGGPKFSDGTASYQIPALFVSGIGNDESSKPWRTWPLEVGKKWTFDADWHRPDGVSGNTKQDVEVVAYEEVVVPTGKYMAYKIEHRGFFRSSKGNRGRQNDTYWYAPDANADVKHVRDDGFNVYTRELVSYKRGTP